MTQIIIRRTRRKDKNGRRPRFHLHNRRMKLRPFRLERGIDIRRLYASGEKRTQRCVHPAVQHIVRKRQIILTAKSGGKTATHLVTKPIIPANRPSEAGSSSSEAVRTSDTSVFWISLWRRISDPVRCRSAATVWGWSSWTCVRSRIGDNSDNIFLPCRHEGIGKI